VVAVDNTGIKVSNRGEWRRKYLGKERQGWIKIHVALDKKTRQVVSFRITGEHAHDSEMFIPLLKQLADRISPNQVKKVLADRGYDSKPNFNYAEKRGIIPTIRPRQTANPHTEQPLTRKRLITTIKKYGYKKWAQKTKYGLRWAIEGFFSTYKRLYGEHLRATSPQGMKKEIIMKLHFYNKLINYKGPSTNP
jgi:hypothetical protein